MKSRTDQLTNRGFVAAGAEAGFGNHTEAQLLAMLKSPLPAQRTVAARLLKPPLHGQSTVDCLIEALKHEKRLYTKLEICQSLALFGTMAVEPLVAVLGLIGHNQHAEVPNTDFRKSSYPLPRDIAARILIRIGVAALPALTRVLSSGNLTALAEAIDAIGHICFYAHQPSVCNALKECFEKHDDQQLIKWKIVRAMSAFPESREFLIEVMESADEVLKPEATRSLELLSRRY